MNFTWWTTVNGTVQVNAAAPPPPPVCSKCGVVLAPQAFQINNQGPWFCRPHAEEEIDRLTRAQRPQTTAATRDAQILLGAMRVIFEAVERDRRAALYRALAPVFHPDAVGGNGEPMALLNAVRDEFRAKDGA